MKLRKSSILLYFWLPAWTDDRISWYLYVFRFFFWKIGNLKFQKIQNFHQFDKKKFAIWQNLCPQTKKMLHVHNLSTHFYGSFTHAFFQLAIINFRGCLADVYFLHWTSMAQLYHILCCLLAISGLSITIHP
jgi:hypothetical protein